MALSIKIPYQGIIRNFKINLLIALNRLLHRHKISRDIANFACGQMLSFPPVRVTEKTTTFENEKLFLLTQCIP